MGAKKCHASPHSDLSLSVSLDFTFGVYRQGVLEYNMSRDMRKPLFCICENKDADQLRDSTIPLLHK